MSRQLLDFVVAITNCKDVLRREVMRASTRENCKLLISKLKSHLLASRGNNLCDESRLTSFSTELNDFALHLIAISTANLIRVIESSEMG
jgi:hypothetical protein